jgi:septal ring factor EnvC (AmiA/AmiB activator)
MAPATLETLADDVALMRAELRSVGETLMRLDGACQQLEQRLIALRDETQDVASEMRDVRRELAAHNHRQQVVGARLAVILKAALRDAPQ